MSCSSDSDEEQNQVPEFDRSTILKNYAENYELKLITTEKDIVRIPKRFHNFIEIIQIEFKGMDL